MVVGYYNLEDPKTDAEEIGGNYQHFWFIVFGTRSCKIIFTVENIEKTKWTNKQKKNPGYITLFYCFC